MKKIKFYCRVIKLYVTNSIITLKDISKSFDKVSRHNESIHLKEITSSSIPMLNEIINKVKSAPKNDLKVLELASGTGFNSNYLYTKLETGSYTLVDISKNSLDYAKSNCNFNCNFVQSDMLLYLKSCSDSSIDLIICAYAISYDSPKAIIKECCRVLKNGGFLGVIDNLRGSYPELKSICSKLLIEHSSLLNNLSVKLNFSRNEYFFEKMFVDNRFNRINLKSNTHILNFNTKDTLCNFITTCGILSPLDSSLNLEDSSVKSSLLNLLQHNNINSLTHKYIWGAFRNDK